MKRIIIALMLILMFCSAAFAQTNENTYPKIEIVSPNEMLVPDNPNVFSVKLGDETEKLNIEYLWTVSSGEIVKGQGTPKIELVVIREDSGANITVSVKLNGLPKDCANTISGVFSGIPPANFDPLTFYGTDANEEKAYIDSLFNPLVDDQALEGLMILHFDKKTSVDKRIKRLRRIIKWIEFRKYDVRQLTFMISKDNSEHDREYAQFMSVTTDSKFFKEISEDKDYKIIKAEELEQKIKEIFPKK